MHGKVMLYQKGHPQRIADLATLLRYLFIGRDGDPHSNHVSRLAGPPVTFGLVQRMSPFGATFQDAAYDLAQQLFEHVRRGPINGALPYEVYKHIVIGFPLGTLNRNFDGDFPKTRLARVAASDFAAVMRTVREFLDAMGVAESLPHLVVVHGDRQHFHAHVATAIYAPGIDGASAFDRLKPSVIHDIAATIYAANKWPFPYKDLEDWYLATLTRPVARRWRI